MLFFFFLISSHSDKQHFCVYVGSDYWASALASSSPKFYAPGCGLVSIRDARDGPEAFRQLEVALISI